MLGDISMDGVESTLANSEFKESVRVKVSQKSYRLIPSHFPPIQLFEGLLEADELEAAYALESMTNDQLREQVGDIYLVDAEDRMVGPGTSAIMAAFTHSGIASRFTAGTYGVYYAGLSLEGALAEAKHSRARFLSDTNEEELVLTMRCYVCDVNAELVDLSVDLDCHQEEWAIPQSKGKLLRDKNELGVLYRSLRREGGENIAIFRPPALIPPANQTKHFNFHWNGQEITHAVEIKVAK